MVRRHKRKAAGMNRATGPNCGLSDVALRARKRAAAPTLGDQIIEWIERECRVPEGALMGEPVRLMDWQKDAIRRIYDNPRRTRRAIISLGRKGGKTSFSAFLLLAHICGPVAVPNSQAFSTAQSRQQAAILFDLASKIVRLSPHLSGIVSPKESAKMLVCPSLGTTYRALSAEAATAYGLSPSFVVHDELGVVRGPRSDLYEALETAGGAQIAPLSVIISTQAESDSDLLSVLIDDAKTANDPHTVLILYTAAGDLDPFDLETIKLANPSLGVHQNPEEILRQAEDARRVPSREASFRRLILNQRIEASSPFITPVQWNACAGKPIDLHGRDVFCGLDLSSTSDLTALVTIGCDIVTGLWHVNPTFWLPGENLHEKARADRTPWDLWHDRGWLQTTPGASISYEYVALHLRTVFDQHRIGKVGFDAWNLRHLVPWLLNAGFSEAVIKEKFVAVGQGFRDMSPALRDLESLILERKLRHGDHPVLRMCCSNCVVERDSAGNRKLNKKRSTGKIDGMTALCNALAVASLRTAVKFDVGALIA